MAVVTYREMQDKRVSNLVFTKFGEVGWRKRILQNRISETEFRTLSRSWSVEKNKVDPTRVLPEESPWFRYHFGIP